MLFFVTISFISCSSEKEAVNGNELKTILSTSSNFNSNNLKIDYMDVNNPDNLHVVINYEKNELDFRSDNMGNSDLVIDNLKIRINTRLDPCNLKYAEISDLIVDESKKLVSQKLDLDELKKVNDIINESIPVIVEYLNGKNDSQLKLLYSLPILKSVITTSMRTIIDKEDCGCLPHPASLIKKSYFACQEDMFYSKEILISSINDFVKTDVTDEDKKDAEDLLKYVSEIDKENIRFDDYYNFYTPKKLYMDNLRSIENVGSNRKISSSKDFVTKAWCPFGKGSSHGCCGNYGGCCVYWNVACYVHDKMCTDCNPRWFCLSGCIPDKLEIFDPCRYK